MAVDQDVRPVWTSDEGTMASETARVRWPRIVNDMVEDVGESLESPLASNERQQEAKTIRSALEAIRKEIHNDADLTSITDKSLDVQWFNRQLELRPKLSWQDAPWLFAECYLYRRVQSVFATSRHWRGYDVFKRQKDSTFVRSRIAVEELAARYLSTVHAKDNMTDDQRFVLFSEMTQVALWGNATDLSLLSKLSLDELQSMQGRQSILKAQNNIVDNDLDEVWAYLNSPGYQEGGREVDIILDNAGFELFTDLIFAAYLLDCGLASRVNLHAKVFPWFVSDAMISDIGTLLDLLEHVESFPEREAIGPVLAHLRNFFDANRLVTVDNWFWTAGSSYHEMPERAQRLFSDLRKSSLVIFKGDLHYRKLTKDGLWPFTTPFKEAIGPMGRTSGLKLLALRTNKADVCVGLTSDAQVRQLEKACPNRGWVRNGRYAVASFSDGQ